MHWTIKKILKIRILVPLLSYKGGNSMNYEFYVTPGEYKIALSNGISRKTLDYRIENLAWSKEKPT